MEHTHECECIDLRCPLCLDLMGLTPPEDAVVWSEEAVLV